MRTMMRTVYRDQRLMDKANSLKGLYEEMRSIQDQFVHRKTEDQAHKDAERRERREQRRRD